MKVTEDIRAIFSILHDGTISAWTGDQNVLTLTVECEYLAECIDKSFNTFYVELIHVDVIELDPWTNPNDPPIPVMTDYADIFKADLGILSADVKDDAVVVTCHQHDSDFGYSGGNLTISCQAIKILDQHKNELTLDQLIEICKNYWDEWSKG